MVSTPTNETTQWRWKRWDVRADGKVFWAYDFRQENCEYWIPYETALSRSKHTKKVIKKYKTQKKHTVVEEIKNGTHQDPTWRWKRWDVRADGKVFWAYDFRQENCEYWMPYEEAIRHLERVRKFKKAYMEIPKNKIRERAKEKIRINKPEHKAKVSARKKSRKYRNLQKKYHERRKSDPVYVLSKRLRCRIRKVICKMGYSKTSKTQEILGCTWKEFKNHIESKFTDGMGWDNKHLWHIDHTIPLATATSIDDVMRLNHYTNLQPLWAVDNLRKGCKILTHHQIP